MKTMKQIPKFQNEQEEAEFWRTHDSAGYVDWSQAKKTVFPNLKPTTESISLRLPSPLLARLKELANEQDVPYQSLMKVYLNDRVKHELKSTKR
jgi:predicted DNA binding CopG/RHH family protein